MTINAKKTLLSLTYGITTSNKTLALCGMSPLTVTSSIAPFANNNRIEMLLSQQAEFGVSNQFYASQSMDM